MSGYLKLPILQWLAKECKESLSCLSQIQINLILNSHAQKIKIENQYLEKLKLQKKGLMQDLLTGKKRVNHLL
jgi:type I restriction enzyme S subunit